MIIQLCNIPASTPISGTEIWIAAGAIIVAICSIISLLSLWMMKKMDNKFEQQKKIQELDKDLEVTNTKLVQIVDDAKEERAENNDNIKNIYNRISEVVKEVSAIGRNVAKLTGEMASK